MSVSYNGNMLIPAPFVTIRKETVRSPDETVLGHTYTVTLHGKLVAWKGSPNAEGSFWTDGSSYPPDDIENPDTFLGNHLVKQAAIRNLFANDGGVLDISGGGSGGLSCNPRIKSVEFSESHPTSWAQLCDYTITVEADCVYGLPEPCDPNHITHSSEEWDIEFIDEKLKTYRLTHNVSATGKTSYSEARQQTLGWQNAQNYVLNVRGLGINDTILASTGVMNTGNLTAYNYVRAQRLDELQGTFAVTETWLCYDPQGTPPAIEDWSVDTRFSLNDALVSVVVQGTITGLQVSDNTDYTVGSTRWANALSYWNNNVSNSTLSRAQELSGATLNPIVLNYHVAENMPQGTITYSYEYNNRASPLYPGAIHDNLTIEDDHQANVFAKITVLGRPLGPILQDIGSRTEQRRVITYEAQMPPQTTTFVPAEPSTNSLFLELAPISTQLFVESDRETWQPRAGRYSRQVAYVYE